MGGPPLQKDSLTGAPLVNFRALPRHLDGLDVLSAKRGVSKSALMREALDRLLEAELDEEGAKAV